MGCGSDDDDRTKSTNTNNPFVQSYNSGGSHVIEILPLSNGRKRRIRLALRDAGGGSASTASNANRRNSKVNLTLTTAPLADDDVSNDIDATNAYNG